MAFVCLRAKATRHGKSRMKSEKAEAASLKPARDRKKKTSQHVNRRNVWLIVATVLLVLGSVFAFMPPQEKINQGLDIQGGLSVVLTAKSTSGDAVSSEDMEKSRSIIESRRATTKFSCRFPAFPTPRLRSIPSDARASSSSPASIVSPTKR